MPDNEFCTICRTLADRATRGQWGVSPDAPNDLDTLLRHWQSTGVMTVTDHWEPTDHPHFTDAVSYAAFRAWHDWLHVTYLAPFNLTGECMTIAFHEAQLTALVGPDKTKEWRSILHYELIENNFGPEATCTMLPT